MKRLLKALLIVVLAIVLIVVAYFAYVFVSYKRIEDNVVLNPDNVGSVNSLLVLSGDTYSIITYNIGFGAYTSDYSFFMDGGKSSWADSEEILQKNITSIGETIMASNPDFAILQEVDTDGTRTYHVNEYERLRELIGEGSYIFAQNYDSAFLMYPLYEPHGANQSGLVTYSTFGVNNAIRRSLPISSSVSKLVDLDRCYSITRIPVDNGKFLCIYNVHLSAYTSDLSVREGQLSMLFQDMEADYEVGNYVICGGDFNHNLRLDASSNAPDWASVFPREELPSGFNLAFDAFDGADISHDSCRNANEAYNPETSFTVLVDGFIISDNVLVVSYRNLNYSYAYSDHDPVVMEFILN